MYVYIKKKNLLLLIVSLKASLHVFLQPDLKSPTDLLLLCLHRHERIGQPEEPRPFGRWCAGEQTDSARLPGHIQAGAAGRDERPRVGGEDEGPGLGAGAAEGEEAGGPLQEDLLQGQAAEAGRGLARVVTQQQRQRGEDAAAHEMSWRP